MCKTTDMTCPKIQILLRLLSESCQIFQSTASRKNSRNVKTAPLSSNSQQFLKVKKSKQTLEAVVPLCECLPQLQLSTLLDFFFFIPLTDEVGVCTHRRTIQENHKIVRCYKCATTGPVGTRNKPSLIFPSYNIQSQALVLISATFPNASKHLCLCSTSCYISLVF